MEGCVDVMNNRYSIMLFDIGLIQLKSVSQDYEFFNSVFYRTSDEFFDLLFNELQVEIYSIQYSNHQLSSTFMYENSKYMITLNFYESTDYRDVNDNWLLRDDYFLLSGIWTDDELDLDTFQELLAYIVSELRGDNFEQALDLFEQKYE